MTPALDMAVRMADYFSTGSKPLGDSFEGQWHVARHPCDDSPYLVGIERVKG